MDEEAFSTYLQNESLDNLEGMSPNSVISISFAAWRKVPVAKRRRLFHRYNIRIFAPSNASLFPLLDIADWSDRDAIGQLLPLDSPHQVHSKYSFHQPFLVSCQVDLRRRPVEDASSDGRLRRATVGEFLKWRIEKNPETVGPRIVEFLDLPLASSPVTAP